MKPKFVFICAAGHSGSTLFDLLLGAHPGGISLGEITQLPKNISLNSICSCGRHLSDCDFWHELITDFGQSIDIDLWKHPYDLDLGFIKAGNEIDPHHQTRRRMMLRKLTYGAEYAHRRWRIPVPGVVTQAATRAAENKRKLFRFILEHAQKEFVVDSSKHYSSALNLYQAAPAETRIIHLLRDGRAVFNSGIGRGMRPGHALAAWLRHSRRSTRLLRKYVPGAALLTVHYEDLAADPASELRRVSEFLDIEYCPQMLKFTATKSHLANGNRMRFSQTSEIKLDERWRKELSASMRHYFERHAGDINRQLGYDE